MGVCDAPRGYWWARHAPDWLWHRWLDRAYERLDAAERAPANHPPGTPTRPGRRRGLRGLQQVIDETQATIDQLREQSREQERAVEAARERLVEHSERIAKHGIVPNISMSADGEVARPVDRWACVRPGCRAHAVADEDGEIVEWIEVMGDAQHEHRLSDAMVAWQDAKRCERDEQHLNELVRRQRGRDRDMQVRRLRPTNPGKRTLR